VDVSDYIQCDEGGGQMDRWAGEILFGNVISKRKGGGDEPAALQERSRIALR